MCCCLQTVTDARMFLVSLYPDLGKELPERTYAEECTVYTPGHPHGDFHNFMDKMDVFVLCHFFGWFVKVIYDGGVCSGVYVVVCVVVCV